MPKEKYIVLCSFILMILLSLFRFSRIISTTLSQDGAIDFHSYWYSGHFVRQGDDPFYAYLHDRDPMIPINYLDGKTINSFPIAQRNLATVPANTALMVLFLSPFAFFSWQTAKIAWMTLNLALLFLTPFLIKKLYPDVSDLPGKYSAMIYLALCGLLATSNAIGNGQTSFLVFTLSLISIVMAKKSWFISSIAMAIALSKYSLSLPFFVFILFFQKKYKIAMRAIVFQILGFISLSWMTKTSLLSMLEEYRKIAAIHINLPGIHLVSAFPTFPSFAYLLVILLAILILWSFVHVRNIIITSPSTKQLSSINAKDSRMEILHNHVLTLLTLWTLLSFYHREYDAIVFILFVALIIFGLTNNYWNISRTLRISLITFTAMITLLMSRPGVSVVRILPMSLAPIGGLLASDRIASVALLLSFGITVWLVTRIRVRNSGAFERSGAADQTAERSLAGSSQ